MSDQQQALNKLTSIRSYLNWFDDSDNARAAVQTIILDFVWNNYNVDVIEAQVYSEKWGRIASIMRRAQFQARIDCI